MFHCHLSIQCVKEIQANRRINQDGSNRYGIAQIMKLLYDRVAGNEVASVERTLEEKSE